MKTLEIPNIMTAVNTRPLHILHVSVSKPKVYFALFLLYSHMILSASLAVLTAF